MNAIVLVGGEGTRLRPLTYSLPKPLIPVLNRPMVSHLLSNLQKHGIDRVVLAANANEPRIEASLGDGSQFGLAIDYSYEVEPLGSGLAIKRAAEHVQGAFFVCNGDILTDLDLTAMIDRHTQTKAIMSVALTSVSDPSSFGIAEVEPDGRITRFLEKPGPGQTDSRWANAGTWLFEPEVLDLIPDRKMDGSIERLVMPSLIAQDHLVVGFKSEAYWMDAGTPERYLQLHHDLLSGRIPDWLPDELASRAAVGDCCDVSAEADLGPQVILDRGCNIGRSSHISGPSILGENCEVGDRTVIENSVIWSRTKIGAGSIIQDSIIGDGCLVGDGCILTGVILANGARAEDQVQLDRGTSLEPGEIAV